MSSFSLSNATGELQLRVQLIVPEGATVLEGTAVDVTANITPIEGGATVQQRPVVQGLGPGLDATVALDTVDVILNGPLPDLEALGPDDVFVILDLTGLLPGNHVITPRVVVPTGIQSTGVLPETVEVVITASTTPTIGPSETVTDTLTPSPNGTVEVTPNATPEISATPVVTATATAATASPLGTPAATPTRRPSRTPTPES